MPQPDTEWTIRRADAEDAEAVWQIVSHPEVHACTLQLPYTSLSRWQQRLARADQRGDCFLAACAPGQTGDVLGLIGVHQVADSPRVAHVRTLGIGVHPNYAGRGIGSALLRSAIDLADNWLNVTRLSLGVYSHNQRAIALYERHGFVREGLSRGLAFGHGRYLDSIEMARLHPRLERTLAEQRAE
ncbi:GNAT family N-acetyltransferase [Kushneria phosphatilytica]|nr:GNAT family N-acetyltransferase [Kushneria phosphatilytica]OHV12930.1 hypothetical protein BH688_02695 [Kushneria phosphatilytica]